MDLVDLLPTTYYLLPTAATTQCVLGMLLPLLLSLALDALTDPEIGMW